MTVLLSFIGLALAALAFVVSARMTRDSRFVDRLGAAVAGGTGLLVLVAATLRPDLLWPSLACLVLSAAWFALAPPVELVQAKAPAPRWQREDA
jgi:hypothetical protein